MLFYSTELGELHCTDCLPFLKSLDSSSVNTVFADPPFNIGKFYGVHHDDFQAPSLYLDWCTLWLRECCRVLRPGGALFLYNLPKWNMPLGNTLSEWLTFRSWITVEQTNAFPIKGRLYPAHYSLLYFTRGEPNTFRRIRAPVEICRHCGKDIKDYGGHRSKLHPDGLTLKDVWTDIPTVRHHKFKDGRRGANTLSTKLLERCILMSTEPGDLVLDPFGGSGTTFAVCEKWDRPWIGAEVNEKFCGLIRDQLTGKVDVAFHENADQVEGEAERVKLAL